jgi:hypothetical protein
MLLYQGLENTLGCGDEVCQLLLALKELRLLLRYNDFDVFDKMEPPRPEMDVK